MTQIATPTEHEIVSFYAALFALGAADGAMETEEVEFVFELLDLNRLSSAGRITVLSFAAEPPDYLASIQALADSELRYALLVNLIAAALADDDLSEQEDHYLQLAQTIFQVTTEQYEEMAAAAERIREAQSRGATPRELEDIFKQSAERFAAVGLPLSAAGALPLTLLWFAGITGFSAAGITSGLSALALGAGMIPGIGVVIGMGIGAFAGVGYLLNRSRRRSQQGAGQIRQRRLADLIAYAKAARDQVQLRHDALADEPDLDGSVTAERRRLVKLRLSITQMISKFEMQLTVLI